MDVELDSSYILLENECREEESAGVPEQVPQHVENPFAVSASVIHEVIDSEQSACTQTRKRKYTSQEKFINILTPKKERVCVFLTPVKRTRRSVINGLKAGHIKVFDNSLEVRSNNTPYVSLVECFKRLERTERRESIDRIVRKYACEEKNEE